MCTVFQVCTAESSEVGLFILKYVHKRFIYHVEPTFTFGALLFYLERFILIGALLFSGALLFFLQSAFLFLHSAFLILHSAPFKISCVSQHLYIFSNCESARYLFILVQLLFQFSSVKRLSLDLWSEILMILCVSIVILILYKTFRF